MQLKTILNQVQKFKCFVYQSVHFIDHTDGVRLEAKLRPRSNSFALCSGCGKPGPGYDTLSVRWFEFVPLWGIKVFCLRTSTGELPLLWNQGGPQMPWAKGKTHRKDAYE